MTLTRSQKLRKAQARASAVTAARSRNPPPLPWRPPPKVAQVAQNKPKKQKLSKPRGGQNISSYQQSLMYPERMLPAKCPDLATMCKTGVFSVQDQYNFSPITGTDDGNVYAGIVLHPTGLYHIVSSHSGGALGFTGVNPTGVTTMSSIYDEARLVSASIVVRYTGRADNCQGVQVIWEDQDGSVPSTVNSANAEIESVNQAAWHDSKVCWRPKDTVDYQFFPVTATGITYPSGDRSHIGIYYKGVDLTANFQATLTWNYECIPKASTGSASLLSPPNVNISDRQKVTSWLANFNILGPSLLGGAATVYGAMNRRQVPRRVSAQDWYQV